MEWREFRLLLVGPVPPPAGGMAMQTLQLADLIRSEGATVDLLPTNPPYRPAWLGRVKGVRALARLLPYVARLWDATMRADLVHVMANSGFAWHLFAAPAIRIARLRRRPTIVNYRGGGAGAFLARHATSVRRTLRGANVVVPSGFLQHAFAGHGIAAQVVPNIVDLDLFHPAPRRPDGLHIVVTRNLEKLYDISSALEAFRRIREQVPGARLSIAGSGPERGSLEHQAVQLGIAAAVTFTGRLDRAEVADLYRRATVALNPSRVDNMPNSILEAMACGVPVVSTNVGGIPYIVGDRETALLVSVGDPAAIASAVLELHTTPELWTGLSQRALADVQRYAWSVVRGQWLDAYRDSLDCPRDPRPAQ